jgi:hypothetical protein
MYLIELLAIYSDMAKPWDAKKSNMAEMSFCS